jgi:hypothetical protein
MKDGHNHTPEEEHRIREAALDETVAGSFPASDPNACGDVIANRHRYESPQPDDRQHVGPLIGES